MPNWNPAALLHGPHGRPLLWNLGISQLRALAAESEGDAWRINAVFTAAHFADTRAGTSRVLFGAAEEEIPEGYGEATLAAQALAEVADPSYWTSLDERTLLEHLIETVDRAAYWQPPSGEDVLAADPLFHKPLLLIAEALAASPLSRWWGDPLPTDAETEGVAWAPQWNVSHRDIDGDSDMSEVNPVRTLSKWTEEARALELRAQRERPLDPNASWGGVWWSTPPAELLTSTRAWAGRGPLALHLNEDSIGPEQAVVCALVVPPSSRVFTINSPKDWAELCRRFPLTVTAEKRQDWYRTTGRAGEWVMPDWQRIAEFFDGVHLSMLGYLRAAGTAIDVADGVASVIAGWDPGMTYWLTDSVRLRGESQHWSRVEPNTHPDPDAWQLNSRSGDRD